jgi:NCS1 family nucleobase:cation symporter-1
VAFGPRAVGLADRVAVPLMLAVAALMTLGALRLPAPVFAAQGTGAVAWAAGLDVVIAYQASWILMFADYSRYTRSARGGAAAVFLGLAGTSLWFMPLGDLGARAAGSADPAAMLSALGLGVSGALLLALGTLTTNFVNLYLSALAWKSLFPRAGAQATLWSIGLVGSALSLLSRAWLDRYADFMVLLGSALVPAGGVLLARLVLAPRPVSVAALYADDGPHAGFDRDALLAWGLGAAAYLAAAPVGGTLPSLAVSTLAALLRRR